MLPPQPIKSGSFPLKTNLFALKKTSFKSYLSGFVSIPFPKLEFDIVTLAPNVSSEGGNSI